jgi:hypothetical protein
MTRTKDLKQVNADTFTAESMRKIDNEDWDKYLWKVLADDFRIKRSNPAILPQDKHQMIAHIRYGADTRERNFSDPDVKVFEDGEYGVVTSVVTLEGQTDRFHNLKVFARQPSGDWQCVYWRVTKLKSQ